MERARTGGESYASWAVAQRGWVVLHGTEGTGKTSLALAAVGLMRLLGQWVPVIRPEQLLGASTGFNTAPDGRSQWEALVQMVAAAPIVVLDDLGYYTGRGPTDDEQRRWNQVLRSRERKPTIITTNLDPTDRSEAGMAAVLDRRTWALLWDQAVPAGGGERQVYDCSGPSAREDRR